MNALLLYWKPLALVLLLALVGFMGYRAGGNAVRSDYEERDIKAANEHAKAIAEANVKLRAAEERSAELLAAADADYQIKLKEHDDAAQKTIADLRAGHVQLRIPVCPGGSAVPQAPASTSVNHGAAQPDVSTGLPEYLVGKFSDCDAIVEQLTGAQAVITADRK